MKEFLQQWFSTISQKISHTTVYGHMKKAAYYVIFYAKVVYDVITEWVKDFYTSIERQKTVEALPPVYAAYQREPTPVSRIVFYVIGVLLFVFILWISLFKIEEIIHATGAVTPQSNVRILSHLEGGVIQEIAVTEGDFVESGQALMRIQDVSAHATLAEATENFYRHRAHIERIRASLAGNSLKLSEDIQQKAPEIAQEATSVFESRKAFLENAQSVIKAQIAQRSSELTDLRNKLKNAEESYALANEQLTVMLEADAKKVAPKTALIKAKMDVTDKKNILESTRENIQKAESALKETEEKLIGIKANQDQEEWREVKDRELRLTEAEKVIKAQEDRLKRAVITAPITGVIQELHVKTVGSAVQPAQKLISLVPHNDQLIIEAQVSPQDIGFVTPGNPVSVKVSSFDFSIYGDLKGVVHEVSPTTLLTEDKRQPYYRITVKTNKNYLEYHGKKFFISPGMTVQADITTGHRTILQFILKPIVKTLSDSLGER